MPCSSAARNPSSSNSSPTRMPERAILSSYAGPMPRPVVPMLPAPRRRSRARSTARWYGRMRCACSLTRSHRSSARNPRFLSASISLTSTSGSSTVPGPIMQTLPGWRMPDGTRFRTVLSPFTTRVCPALLPPWKRTTTSASAARRATTLPFPSSPHWVPITTVAGIRAPAPGCQSRSSLASEHQHQGANHYPSLASEHQDLRRDDRRKGAQLVEHVLGYALVDVDQRQRRPTDLLPAELDPGNVDAALAEQRPDLADDPGDVAIVQHENGALRHGLHEEVVDAREADDPRPEHRPREAQPAGGRAHVDGHGVLVPRSVGGA